MKTGAVRDTPGRLGRRRGSSPPAAGGVATAAGAAATPCDRPGRPARERWVRHERQFACRRSTGSSAPPTPACCWRCALILCCAVAAFLLLPADLGRQGDLADDRAAGDLRRVRDSCSTPSASCSSPAARSRFDVTKAIADSNSDGLIVTDADSRIALRQRRLPRRCPAPRARPTCDRSSGCSPARRKSPRRSTGWRRPRAAARARVEELRLAPPLVGRRRGGLVPHPRPPARRRRAARRDAVDGQRHHPRARAPRELLPGPAARDRLSRPRAGRLLLRRSGRLDRPI